MIVHDPEDARYLPPGTLALEIEGEEFGVTMDESYVRSAAKFLISVGFKDDVSSQADLVREAVNHYKWGVGSARYTAVTNPKPLRKVDVR